MVQLNRSDFLVIGSGIAGLYAAIRLADHGDVTVVTKRSLMESNTNLAQGGIASVFAKTDSFESHVEDTLHAGAGLCRPEIVNAVVREGPKLVRELIEFGVGFTRNVEGELALGREGGHSARRIVHTHDLTGREIERVLVEVATAHPAIRFCEIHLAVDLILRSRAGGEVDTDPSMDRCLGAFVMEPGDNAIRPYLAKVTLLSTGGTGKAYLYTSNPDIATGDGLAMAYRAGARLANLEFVQFHPTCLYHSVARSFLISEAARGEGGRLTTIDGTSFTEQYDPRGDLAPRDIVARAIDAELKHRGDPYVLLHMEHLAADEVRRRFPQIHERLMTLGIDITREPVPVVPAAHYMCGGVVTDMNARTDLPGLLAAGEVAHTGMHGANRLASNSLLEAVILARRAVDEALLQGKEADAAMLEPEWDAADAVGVRDAIILEHDWNHVRTVMWDYVGIVRTNERLQMAASRIRTVRRTIVDYFRRYLLTPDLVELRNIALVADLIVRCAIARRESRGLHYTADYPERDDRSWKRDTILSKHMELE